MGTQGSILLVCDHPVLSGGIKIYPTLVLLRPCRLMIKEFVLHFTTWLLKTKQLYNCLPSHQVTSLGTKPFHVRVLIKSVSLGVGEVQIM